ncbi:MAG: methyltransferase [Patescibacteria group bacterium]|jgi:release factor glutamine methyltransferase
MLTQKQLANITRLQKIKQKQFRSVPADGTLVEYLGKKFIVYPNVFWPYEDSMLLVQKFVINPGERVLDIGTGCGVIAIMAANQGAKQVVAVDINPAAIQATNQNARKHGVANIIDARCSNLFAQLHNNEIFDVITVNLPYRNKTAKDDVEASFWDSEFNSYKNFFSNVHKYLNKHGRIYLAQANYGDIDAMKQLAKAAGLDVKLIGKKAMAKDDPRIFYAFVLRRK